MKPTETQREREANAMSRRMRGVIGLELHNRVPKDRHMPHDSAMRETLASSTVSENLATRTSRRRQMRARQAQSEGEDGKRQHA